MRETVLCRRGTLLLARRAHHQQVCAAVGQVRQQPLRRLDTRRIEYQAVSSCSYPVLQQMPDQTVECRRFGHRRTTCGGGGRERQHRHFVRNGEQGEGIVHGTGCLATAVPGDHRPAAERLKVAGIGDDQNRPAGMQYGVLDEGLGEQRDAVRALERIAHASPCPTSLVLQQMLRTIPGAGFSRKQKAALWTAAIAGGGVLVELVRGLVAILPGARP